MKRLAVKTRFENIRKSTLLGGLAWAHLGQSFLGALLACNLLYFSLAKAAEAPENAQNWRPSELYFGSYLATDRQKKREIEVAKQLIERQKYTDGIRLLAEILAPQSDSLDPSRRSLKRQAAEILGSLPPAGQRTYATMFENQLERDLRIALEQRNQESLAKLAASFPPEAWSSLETWRDDSSGPDAMRPDTTGHDAMGPNALGYHAWKAWAWTEQELGNYAIAASIRASIQKSLEPSSDLLSSTLPNAIDTSFERRLDMVDEHGSLEQPTQRWLDRSNPRQWLGPGGGPERRFAAPGTIPTSWRRWHAITGEHASSLDALQSKMPEQAATLPASNAIAVEGVIVVRQGEQLIAIEADSGKREWVVNLSNEMLDQSVRPRQNSSNDRLPPQIDPLSEEAWLDRVQGTITSDSRSVFVITPSQHDGYASSFVQDSFGRGSRNRSNIEPTNALACYDLVRQGKLRWRIDGADSLGQKELSNQTDSISNVGGVRFLGAPTPVEDWLAVLAEQQGMIRFLLLESKTGKVIWQQPLVSYSGMRQTDTLRRIGVSPTWHEGKFYCPTGAGVILALDPLRRSIAWVAHVPIDQKLLSQGNLSSGRTGLRTADSRLRIGNGWRETRIVAQKERVVVATSESNRLSCFDSSKGDLRWSHAMENGLLLSSVAKVREEAHVLVIESKSLTALKLSDGSKLWRVYFESGDRPAGDGLLLGDEYLLPLQSSRLAHVSLLPDTAQRISYIKQGTDPLDKVAKPGNLLIHQGALYTRSPYAIERYDQPIGTNTLLSKAEWYLEKGNYKKAYEGFDNLLDEGPSKGNFLSRQDLIKRRDASALLAERDGVVSNPLRLSPELEAEQRIEPLLYRFQSLVRQNELKLAKALGEKLLARPESKIGYVAPHNKRVVLIERWVESQLSMLEQKPRSIDLAEAEQFTLSANGNSLDSDAAWSTNQIIASLSVAKSDKRQQQPANFSRRNLRTTNHVPQRLGIRGESSWVTKWEVYNTGGEKPDLVGRNRFGEIAFAEQLPGAVEGSLLASVVGESASCCWGNRMLVQLGEAVVAYDLSVENDLSRMLWNSQTLDEQPLNALPLYEAFKEPSVAPKRTVRNRSDRGDKLYCLDAWGAIVRRDDKIACVDSTTGKLLWSVNDFSSYDRIFSYEDRIFCGRTSSRQGVILSKQEGSVLGNWYVPNGDWRSYSNGRLFLTTRGEAQLCDMTQEVESILWKSSLKGKQYALVDDAILLLDNVGHLECVDMATGNLRFEAELRLPSSRLPFLQTWLVGEQLLVGLSQQSTSGHRQLGYTPLGEQPLITGLLYNLDRQSGKSNWTHPVELEGAGLLQDCLAEAKLLYFGGRVQNTQSNSGTSLNRILVLDLASGRTLFRNDRLPPTRQGRANFQVLKEIPSDVQSNINQPELDRTTNIEQLLVQLGSAQLRLELTHEPSPPSPPALAQVERPRQHGVDFNEFSQELTRLFEEITQPIEKPDQ